MEGIDIVYVLGSGSAWMNNELRFSLRSVEKNLNGFRNIYVVGEDPGFLNGVKFIPHPDEIGPQNADGNIIRKVLRVCQEKSLSDNFLFINDDHLVIKPVSVADIHPFHKGDMTTYHQSYWRLNIWRSRLKRTCEVLTESGYPAYHFDCHTPIIFNKRIFPKTMEQFPYHEGIGLTMKSLYGNVNLVDHAVELSTQKRTIFKRYTHEQITDRLSECFLMSFNDDGLNRALKVWLYEEFAALSRYETGNVQDDLFKVIDWMNAGEDYDAGVELFASFGKDKNLIKLFSRGRSPLLERKLSAKLRMKVYETFREENEG